MIWKSNEFTCFVNIDKIICKRSVRINKEWVGEEIVIEFNNNE